MTKEVNKKHRQEIRLQAIFDSNQDKRIVVVGTTCTGKSTFLKTIKNAVDMDEEVFPQLTPKEIRFVNQIPWTAEIGQTMNRLVKEKVKIKPGKPVFGTVVLDSDLIIYLKINDDLLRQRTISRNAQFEDAKNMQKQIEEEIKKSRTPFIEIEVE